MLVSIGTFSRVSRLSPKALRLYERLGLLLPAEVIASSSYRRYHVGQLRRAETIRFLRAAETPLGDIARLLEQENAGRFGATTIEQLRQRVQTQHAARLRALDELATLAPAVAELAAELCEQPAETLAVVRCRTTAERLGDDLAAAFAELGQRIDAGLISPLGPPLCVHHDAIDAESAGDIEVAVPVGATFVADGVVGKRALRAHTAATLLHRGPYPRIGAAMRRLLQWTFEQQLTVVGPPCEVYEDDPRIVPPEALRTRLRVPVVHGAR